MRNTLWIKWEIQFIEPEPDLELRDFLELGGRLLFMFYVGEIQFKYIEKYSLNKLRNRVYGTRSRFGAPWFPRAGRKFVVSVCCGNLWLPRDNWLNLVSNVIPFSQQKKYGSCCTEIHFSQRRNKLFISFLGWISFCLQHGFDKLVFLVFLGRIFFVFSFCTKLVKRLEFKMKPWNWHKIFYVYILLCSI